MFRVSTAGFDRGQRSAVADSNPPEHSISRKRPRQMPNMLRSRADTDRSSPVACERTYQNKFDKIVIVSTCYGLILKGHTTVVKNMQRSVSS